MLVVLGAAGGDCAYTLTYLDTTGFTADVFLDKVGLPQANEALSGRGYVGAITTVIGSFQSLPVSGVRDCSGGLVLHTGCVHVISCTWYADCGLCVPERVPNRCTHL